MTEETREYLKGLVERVLFKRVIPACALVTGGIAIYQHYFQDSPSVAVIQQIRHNSFPIVRKYSIDSTAGEFEQTKREVIDTVGYYVPAHVLELK